MSATAIEAPLFHFLLGGHIREGARTTLRTACGAEQWTHGTTFIHANGDRAVKELATTCPPCADYVRALIRERTGWSS